MQCPVETPITGVGKDIIRRAIFEPRDVNNIACSGPLAISFRSKPPEKRPSRPLRTTIALDASALSKASLSSSHMS